MTFLGEVVLVVGSREGGNWVQYGVVGEERGMRVKCDRDVIDHMQGLGYFFPELSIEV